MLFTGMEVGAFCKFGGLDPCLSRVSGLYETGLSHQINKFPDRDRVPYSA